MKYTRARTITATVFRSAGYVIGSFGWLWLILVLLPGLIQSGALESLVSPAPPPVSQPTAQAEPLSPIVLIAVGIMTLLILIVTIVVLIKVPRTIAQNSDKVVTRAAEQVVPLITHHTPVPQRERKKLTRRIIITLQALFSILPIALSLALPEQDALPQDVIRALSIVVGLTALFLFSVSWAVEPKLITSQTRSRASRGLR